MRYTDRISLLLLLAVVASAQQTAPAPADAEAALRARAQQFFQLQVEKKYRPAEAMVADDTKDYYYSGKRFNINTFSIEKIELLDDNTRARVTIDAKITRPVPGFGFLDFAAPSITLWKIENGQWVYYVDQTAVVPTPFGPVENAPGNAGPPAGSMAAKMPDVSTFRNLVKIDRESVDLTRGGPVQTVTVSNELPGGVDLALQFMPVDGLSAQLEKMHLEAGAKTAIQFRATGQGKATATVHVSISPIMSQMDIRVNIN